MRGYLVNRSFRRTLVLVLFVGLAICLVADPSLAQDPAKPPNWNGTTPQQTPPGFVSAHTFYWMIGVGTTIVGALTTVIGVLWSKLNTKVEDDDKNILKRLDLLDDKVKTQSDNLAALAETAKNEREALRTELQRKDDLLAAKDERLDKQHEKTLKIAVRAQQAVEALANLPIGENVLGNEED